MAHDTQLPGGSAGGPVSAYQGLVYNILQSPREGPQGAAIAITSPTRGTGTSFVVRALANELGAHPTYRILRADLATLARTINSAEDVLTMVMPTEQATIFSIAATPASIALNRSASFWHASADHRRECIERLRASFNYILFDCPALRESGDTLGIATLVDGLLLVFESGSHHQSRDCAGRAPDRGRKWSALRQHPE